MKNIKFNIDIYFTNTFWLMAAAIVTLTIFGHYSNILFTISVALSILFFIAAAVDLFVSAYRINNLDAHRVTDKYGVIRAENTVTIKIKNYTNQTYNCIIIDEIPLELRNKTQRAKLKIKAKDACRTIYSYYPTKRGEYIFNRILLFIPGYFNLLHNRASFNQTENITVLPNQRTHPKDVILVDKNNQIGEKIIKHKGQSFEFDQITDYILGDDIRFINWAATARTHQVKVNRFTEEKSHNLYFLIDRGRTMNYTSNNLSLLDYSINASAHLAQVGLKQGDKIGTLVFSNKLNAIVKAQKNPNIIKLLLKTWGTQSYKLEHSNYTTLYSAVQQTINQRSLLFLFTNFDTYTSLQEQIQVFRKLNNKHLLVVVFFKDRELETFTHTTAQSFLQTSSKIIARQVYQDQILIKKELEKHKIKVILCHPEELMAKVKSSYMQIKRNNSI